jgi:hypothetical protein
MRVFDKKEETERCEQVVAVELVDALPSLDNRVVTADALHCQRKLATAIVEKCGSGEPQPLAEGRAVRGGPLAEPEHPPAQQSGPAMQCALRLLPRCFPGVSVPAIRERVQTHPVLAFSALAS